MSSGGIICGQNVCNGFGEMSSGGIICGQNVCNGWAKCPVEESSVDKMYVMGGRNVQWRNHLWTKCM